MTDPKPVDAPEVSPPVVVTPEEAAKVKGGSTLSILREAAGHVLQQQHDSNSSVISNLNG